MLKMADANSAMMNLMTNGKGGSKGKGKGGGKGKGAGKNSTAAAATGLQPNQNPTNGQWLCRNHVCSWAQQRIPNAQASKRCQNSKCCLLKGEAMNPPEGERVQHQTSPSTSFKSAKVTAAAAAAKQKSAAAAAEKAKQENERTALAEVWVKPPVRNPLSEEAPGAPKNWRARPPPPPGTALSASLETPHPKNLEEAFKQSFPDGKPSFSSLHVCGILDLLPALQPMLASLREEALPIAEDFEPDSDKAKATVLELLGSATATATLSEIAEAESRVARSNAVVVAYQNEQSTEAEAARNKLAADEAALAKISKRKPSPAEEKAAIALAKDAYAAKVETRKAQMETGKTKYTQRATWRAAYLDTLQQQLQEARDEMEDQEQRLQDAHLEKAQNRFLHDAAVYAALEQRAKEVSDGTQQPEPADEAHHPQFPTPTLPQRNPELDALAVQNAHIRQQLEEMTKLYHQTQQQLQANAAAAHANPQHPAATAETAAPSTLPNQEQQPHQAAPTTPQPPTQQQPNTQQNPPSTDTTSPQNQLKAQAWAHYQKEEARLDSVRPNIRDLPKFTLDEFQNQENLQASELLKARASLDAAAASNVVPTYKQLGLPRKALDALLGEVMTAIYDDANPHPPRAAYVPSKLIAMLRIQLGRLATVYNDLNQQDEDLLQEAYDEMHEAKKSIPSPYA